MRPFRTTPRMIWSTVYRMAKTASSAPTTKPAAAPAIRPSHRFPEALATIAAMNAPSSSWPSIPMFTTPDREQITPVSAPSMIGMDWLSVPWNRFTMLNVVVWPAPAQHIRARTNRNTTTPMVTRRQTVLSGTTARSAASTSDSAPHAKQVSAAGSERLGMVTLANGWEDANGTSPWGASRPNTKMYTSPNTGNAVGASQRRQVLTGAASALTTWMCSVMVMPAPSRTGP